MEESDDTAVRRTRSTIAKSAKVTPAKPIRQKPGPLSKKKKKMIEVSDDEDEKKNDSSEEKTEAEKSVHKSEEKSVEKSEEKSEEKVEVNGSGNNIENKEAEDTEVILNDIVMLEDDSGEKKNEAETKMDVDEVTNTNDTKSEESKPDSEPEKVDSSSEKNSKTEEKEPNEKSPETKTETTEDSNGVDESVTDDEPLKKKKKLNVKENKEEPLDETEKSPEIKDKEEKKEEAEIKEKAESVELKLDEEETKPDAEETKSNEKEVTEESKNEKEEKDDNKNESEEKDDKQKADPDTENISEDELPSVQAVKVPEAEEVSDEELPGPKRAELPADTEVVSEDELPTVKSDTKKESGKRKRNETDYDPGSPTSENETSSKKQSLETSTEKEKEEKPKPKKLPELDKYWKAVNDDPTDFTGWTYLLQYVDQENDMEAAREAYDAFLSHYPYCYGYWRKYADYEKRKGNKKKCEEVFERGLKAIPLSVDLWIHYLTYVKTTRTEDEDFIRAQFERALLACGLEFRSDRLWDSYIKWENEGKRLQKVTAIYDRLMTTPTQGYTSHFENFQEHVSANAPNKILDVDEFLALRKEVKQQLKHDISDAPPADSDAPPGEEEQSKPISSDEETKALRERIISIRRKVHKNTINAVTARWNYEEGIKRPYFHVKPLERCQLKNWQDYLDYETEQGDKVRIIVLFERCLIACALYEEFWLKFVHYLENLKDAELTSKIRDVYERACTIHHLKKPNLHLQWAMFEECIDNINRAAEILVNLEKSVPNVLQIAYRRINLERRRGDHEKCIELYEHYINTSKNKIISSSIAIKYSRFTYVILKDINKAQEILKSAIAKDPHNPRLYLQLIDLTLHKENVTEEEVIQVMNLFLEKENTDPEQKVLFSQRKLEYLEDFGTSIKAVQEAHDQHQKILKWNKEILKKKEVKSDPPTASKSKEVKTTPPSSVSNSYNSGAYGPSNQPSYPAYSGSQQGANYYPQYNQNDQYQYQNWQYPQGGYGGYNQWGGYSGGYGY